jgi:hypothetical protein
MATFNEKAAQIPLPAGDDALNKKPTNDSAASSITRAEPEHDTEGAAVAPHHSQHARFGENQVFVAKEETNGSNDLPAVDKAGTHDKIELTEDMCYDELGFNFPSWKKW